jgi:16S rRNA (cytidine1402-2'-O)-methyltransferase
MKKIAVAEVPVVFYESVHRIEKTLNQLANYLGGKPVIICRELTKKFEHIYRGSPKEVLKQLRQDKVKGEFVVIVSKSESRNI